MQSPNRPQFHLWSMGLRWLVEFPSLASPREVPPYLRRQVFDPHTYPACSHLHPRHVQNIDKMSSLAGHSPVRSPCAFVVASTSEVSYADDSFNSAVVPDLHNAVIELSFSKIS